MNNRIIGKLIDRVTHVASKRDNRIVTQRVACSIVIFIFILFSLGLTIAGFLFPDNWFTGLLILACVVFIRYVILIFRDPWRYFYDIVRFCVRFCRVIVELLNALKSRTLLPWNVLAPWKSQLWNSFVWANRFFQARMRMGIGGIFRRAPELPKILANLFEISGYIVKNIKTSQESSTKAIKTLMNKMGLEIDQQYQAENLFHQGKQASEEKIKNLIIDLKDQYHEKPEILNVFVMILMEFTYLVATNNVNMIGQIKKTIKTVTMQLDFNQTTLDSIEVIVRVKSQNLRDLDLKDIYKMIGISGSSSHPNTIKKVARNLRKTYHPDALRRKGIPQEMLVFGSQLSQTLNSTYNNHIKKLR